MIKHGGSIRQNIHIMVYGLFLALSKACGSAEIIYKQTFQDVSKWLGKCFICGLPCRGIDYFTVEFACVDEWVRMHHIETIWVVVSTGQVIKLIWLRNTPLSNVFKPAIQNISLKKSFIILVLSMADSHGISVSRNALSCLLNQIAIV